MAPPHSSKIEDQAPPLDITTSFETFPMLLVDATLPGRSLLELSQAAISALNATSPEKLLDGLLTQLHQA